eukprot:g2536.t1
MGKEMNAAMPGGGTELLVCLLSIHQLIYASIAGGNVPFGHVLSLFTATNKYARYAEQLFTAGQMRGSMTVSSALGNNFVWMLSLAISGRTIPTKRLLCEQQERVFRDLKLWLQCRSSFRWEEVLRPLWCAIVARQVKKETDTPAHKLDEKSDGRMSKLWDAALASGAGALVGLSALPNGRGYKWELPVEEVKTMRHVAQWLRYLVDFARGQHEGKAGWWEDCGDTDQDGACATVIYADMQVSAGARHFPFSFFNEPLMCDALLIDTSYAIRNGLSIPGWKDMQKLISWLNNSGDVMMRNKMKAFLKSAGCLEAADGKVTCEVPDTVHDALLQQFWIKCPLCDNEGRLVDPG